MKRALLALFCALGTFATPAGASPARPLSEADVARIDAFTSVFPFDQGRWGILATDLETGRQLYSRNPDQLFHTASTTKNFTVAAALDGLGPGRRFRTPLLRRGRDLVLRASGDLTWAAGRSRTGASPTPASTTWTPTRCPARRS